MRELVEAVAASIEAEVPDAVAWLIHMHDPMWRSPKEGKSLNIWAETRGPAEDTPNRWIGYAEHEVPVIVEFKEPSGQTGVTRDEEAELQASETTDALVEWAVRHEAGFRPAWRMDLAEASYAPAEAREYFVRYCRMRLVFRLTVALADA